MSHIVTIRTQIRDAVALAAACSRLSLAAPVQGTTRLYSSQATGLIVRLPGWIYPAVVDVTTGAIAYDNFEGSWGDPKELDKFMQAYAVEKAKLEARKAGHSVSERSLANGSITLTVSVAGGAA